MSAALNKPPRMSVAEFIDMIRPYPDEERWELLDGVPVLMAPQSERHQRLVTNFWRSLDSAARRVGCVALPGLGLLNDTVDDYAPIPDIVVRCGPVLDGSYARDPVLVAEVLSPSTMNNDRGRKLDFFRSIPSLAVILIVYQDEPRLEAWIRDAGDWRREVRQGTAAPPLGLPRLDGSLALAEIYEDMPFEG